MIQNALNILILLLPIAAEAKPNLAGLANHESHGKVCERLYAEVGESQARKGYDKAERIRRRDAVFAEINESDNENFLPLAKAANAGESTIARLFLDIENAVLKILNDDVIKDRELVTALTNVHKKLVWSVISGDPVLAEALVGKYSDFKSLRFAFRENTPELQRRAAAALTEINKRYEQYVADLVQQEGWAARMKGLTADARNWYHGGVGSTPDQAGVATRFSRENLGPDGVAVLRAFDKAAPALQQAAFNASRFQRWAARRFAGPMLVGTPGGKKVLSAEAIEAIKKTVPGKGEELSFAVARVLNARFGAKVEEREARALLNYISMADQFSPGLLLGKRVVIEMEQPAAAVISADFKGQNARNLEETMKALADTDGQHITARLQAVRAGEIRATEALENKKARFGKAMGRFAEEMRKRGRFTRAEASRLKAEFTGDDGVMFLPSELSAEERALAQKFLLEEMQAEDIRLAFVNFGGGEASLRSGQIVNAEGLEKKLRNNLVGRLAREKLNDLQIGVYLEPEGSYRLHLARRAGATVSAEEEAAVRALAKELGFSVK